MRFSWARSAVVLACVASAAGALLVVTNPAPRVPAIAVDDAAASALPYVIKLHARWCPICIATKGAWADVQQAYAGRVRFVVFDFTDAATTAASRADATRLGLDNVFDAYAGETGTVLVLDAKSRDVTRSIHGVHRAAAYRAAIDAALAGMRG